MNSPKESNPASKFKQQSRKRKNLRDHSYVNASEVIPQPCISSVNRSIPRCSLLKYGVRGQLRRVNGINIYQGHVARKPFIAKVCIIILRQLVGLQLTFIHYSPEKIPRKVEINRKQSYSLGETIRLFEKQTLRKESRYRSPLILHVECLMQLECLPLKPFLICITAIVQK